MAYNVKVSRSLKSNRNIFSFLNPLIKQKNILLFEENGCYSSSPFGSYEALDILGIKSLSNNCCTYKMSKCEFKNFIELVYFLNKCSYQWIKDFVNCLKYIKDDEKVLLYISY